MWLSPADESWQAIDNIILCGFPKLVNKREQFRFTAENITRVKRHAQAFNYRNDFVMADDH